MYLHSTIKKILCAVFLGIIFFPATAQNKPAYEMKVNGVKVIVQPSGNQIVEILTVFKGGVQNYPASEAGIESLAFTALTECGTKNDSKNSFKDKLDVVNADIDITAGMDYSSIRLNCIQSDFEQVWPLYMDAITVPLFDTTEFTRIKQDAINQLKASASQPDDAISKLAMQTAFKGKPYATSPGGEEETVSKLTVEQTRTYYQSILTRSRLLIVIVGELDKATIEKKIKEFTDRIPEGKAVVLSKYAYAPVKNTFVEEKKPLATNYIQGITGAPLPGTEDFNAFSIARRLYSQHQFLEVRTNNGLSYAPGAQFHGGLSSYTELSVSTTNPDKYIAVVNALLEKTHQQGFSEDQVKDAKSGYITQFYSKMETNSAQAASLAANEILFNDWKRSLRINEDLKKVTVDQVNKAFNKYVQDITWVYQGDTSKVNPVLFTSKAPDRKLPDNKIKNANKN